MTRGVQRCLQICKLKTHLSFQVKVSTILLRRLKSVIHVKDRVG